MNDPENDESQTGESVTGEPSQESGAEPAAKFEQSTIKTLLQMPGLVAVALYMIVLAGIDIVSVAGHQIRTIFLILAVLWIAAGLGLLMLQRWAWAMTAATLALLVALLFWRFAANHQFPFAVQGLMSLIVFFYLVRTSVRAKLH
jgi:hypothetical protein